MEFLSIDSCFFFSFFGDNILVTNVLRQLWFLPKTDRYKPLIYMTLYSFLFLKKQQNPKERTTTTTLIIAPIKKFIRDNKYYIFLTVHHAVDCDHDMQENKKDLIEPYTRRLNKLSESVETFN